LTISHGTQLGRYEIRSKLGAGGMGEVYLAQDRELARTVALKILPAEFTTDQKRLQRFLQEARAASALNHPNILTVHEFGQADSVRFIATEYVDGQTLRQHLERAPVTISQALDVAIQVASALSAAHAAGIVHRDIKPENIMLRKDGIVKVLDFGLAKLVERQSTTTIDTKAPTRALINTEPGVVMGTAYYMSPEQARGLEVDARTDIWSLGCVLYEMIERRPPFTGATTTDVVAAIVKTAPEPLTNLTSEAPAKIEEIVFKALEKDREERYQGMGDLLVDLRRLKKRIDFEDELKRSHPPEATTSKSQDRAPQISAQQTVTLDASQTREAETAQQTSGASGIIRQHKRIFAIAAVVLLLAAIGLGYWFSKSPAVSSNATPIESIAVLPFVNESGNADNEYLSDGVTESLINSLSQLPNLRVIARSTVFNFKGKNESPQQIGQTLNVRAVMTGKITQQKDSLIVQVDLVDVANNTELWGNRFNIRMADLLQVEEQIASQIVSKLQLRLDNRQQAQVTKQYTQNAEAYNEYLKGRFYTLQFTPDGHQKALEHLNKAIEIDPTYALAYAGIADAYTTVSDWLLPPSEALTKAKAAAQKALELDDQLAEAYAARGHARLHEWDRSAIDDLNRAISLAPNVMTNYLWLGEYYMEFNPPQAVPVFQKAAELDPLSAVPPGFMSYVYVLLRQPDMAIKSAQKAKELAPNDYSNDYYYVLPYALRGDYQAAIDMLNQIPPEQRDVGTMGAKAYILALQGQRAEAEGILEEMRKQSQQNYVSPIIFASVYSALGDRDKTFFWLDKAFQDRSEALGFIRNDFRFDPIRNDPRYKELLQRIGFTQ
jgi:serine/threonine protein kinase/tetratricopeptide (TPR) repeat protein